MIKRLPIISIFINFLLLINYETVQTQILKTNKKICDLTDRSISSNPIEVCYLNDISNDSILISFVIHENLNDTFHSYRFTLQSVDDLSSSNDNIKTLTNFTDLIDFNNSLRIFNLDLGEYEICIELQSNFLTFIYRLRDGCIHIHIGKSSSDSFKGSPKPLLITLAIGIVVFFILGLIVQWIQKKRQNKAKDESNKPRMRSSSILSTISLRQQRDRLIQNLFHRHIENPRPSRMRQWARNIASRHRISTPEPDRIKPRSFRKRSKQIFTSSGQSSQARSRDRTPSLNSILTTNNVYTISEKEHSRIPSRKTSFHISTSEMDIEMP